MADMKPQHKVFLDHYLKSGNGAEAARVAGYAKSNAAQTASQLLRTPAMKEAVLKAREGSIEATSYTLDKAMRETDACIEFAKITKNAGAMIKSIEHKAKLNGLLVEKHEVKTAGFVINISGMDDLNNLPEANKLDLLSSPTEVKSQDPTLPDSLSETDE